ncbi:helix-turn-helix domain-containing protein [Flagellimonas allohymeniacidonis]|uniref:AraC family transcriptional regulator n=1 Tax=Flagellimonas allohymeniacidonis TaxID=2517819 RepID=A0A4Q8QER9_9FLAO|nr:AraC family transcriptional regulator [Allomuricauda hymeniacidonis]TAI47678.1 AraC family transcriptional regulator [Allomuricauda hymeniacidonis]
MAENFHPQFNKVYFINSHTVLHILSGSGKIQVDFKNYGDWKSKAIYLEKGQYIKFLSDDFRVLKMEFPAQNVFKNHETRVLFKHLVSLGYINCDERTEGQNHLTASLLEDNVNEVLDVSLKQWYGQNPFNASRDEYRLIFDLKEIIDKEFANRITIQDLQKEVNSAVGHTRNLVKEKLGITIKNLLENKRITESKKKVAFTDLNIQEIAYEMGYKDPAYFNRIFKTNTGTSPIAYRSNFDFEKRDSFVEDLLHLLKKHHTSERSLAFYADKMNLSPKTFAQKTSSKMNDSFGRLVRHEIITTAKKLLWQGASVKEVSLYLKFEEPNHFSSFFKRYVGLSPTDFLLQKVQEKAPFL